MIEATIDFWYGDGAVKETVTGETPRQLFENALEHLRQSRHPASLRVWLVVPRVTEKLRKLARERGMYFHTYNGGSVCCYDEQGREQRTQVPADLSIRLR